MGNLLKEDIAFLEEILEKIESQNVYDNQDGEQMLKDQISHMQGRIVQADARKKCSPGRHALYPDCNYCPICGEELRSDARRTAK